MEFKENEKVKVQNRVSKKIYNGIVKQYDSDEGEEMFGTGRKDEYAILLDNKKTISIDTENILSLYKFID